MFKGLHVGYPPTFCEWIYSYIINLEERVVEYSNPLIFANFDYL